MKRKNTKLLLVLGSFIVLSVTGCESDDTSITSFEEQLSTIEDTLATEVTESPEDVTTDEVSSEPVTIYLHTTENTYLADDENTEILTTILQLPEVQFNNSNHVAKINQAFADASDETLSIIEGSSDVLEGDILYNLVGYAQEDFAMRLENGSSAADYNGFYYEQSYQVQRADSRVLSMIYDQIAYTGGAHGSDFRCGISYDFATGDQIMLKDLSEDLDSFTAFCVEQITALADARMEEEQIFFPEYRDSIPYIISDDTFYFSDEGLVFISQEYMLQPYAAGIITFTIPYNDLSGYLKEQYMPVVGAPDFIVIDDGDVADAVEVDFENDVAVPMLSSFLTWNGLQYFYNDHFAYDSLTNNIAVNLCAFAILYDQSYNADDYDDVQYGYRLSDSLLNEYALDYFGQTLDLASFTETEESSMVAKNADGTIIVQEGDWGLVAPDFTIESCTEDENGNVTVQVSYFSKDYEYDTVSDTLATATYLFQPDMDSKFGYVIKGFQFELLQSAIEM